MLTTQNASFLALDIPFPARVHEWVGQFRDLWYACDADLPDLGPVYTPKEKKNRQGQLGLCLDGLTAEMEHLPSTPAERQAAEGRVVARFAQFAHAAFGMQPEHILALQTYGFVDATQDFVRQARSFDPAISAADILQASRNSWSMNLLQLLMGLPIEITPAVLAYSLLYPYTDNYLDNPDIASRQKAAFSLHFQQRLEGQQISPANPHEQKIFDLVGMIESQFDRSAYPGVYDSLLAIYWAQTNSLRLLRANASPYETDVLGMALEKGGASVLADGYLVAGTLTPEQCEFMFTYGTFTQLMDDLEDVDDDLKAGLNTVFSQTARYWPLDMVTNRTFHLGERVLDALDRFAAPGLEPLKEMMRLAINPLLIDSVSQHGRWYTRSYLHSLESHFPFGFGFLREQRKKLGRRKFSLERLIEMLVASSPGA